MEPFHYRQGERWCEGVPPRRIARQVVPPAGKSLQRCSKNICLLNPSEALDLTEILYQVH